MEAQVEYASSNMQITVFLPHIKRPSSHHLFLFATLFATYLPPVIVANKIYRFKTQRRIFCYIVTSYCDYVN